MLHEVDQLSAPEAFSGRRQWGARQERSTQIHKWTCSDAAKSCENKLGRCEVVPSWLTWNDGKQAASAWRLGKRPQAE